jgi:hypothetical protein
MRLALPSIITELCVTRSRCHVALVMATGLEYDSELVGLGSMVVMHSIQWSERYVTECDIQLAIQSHCS